MFFIFCYQMSVVIFLFKDNLIERQIFDIFFSKPHDIANAHCLIV